jgi:hypothetical protein
MPARGCCGGFLELQLTPAEQDEYVETFAVYGRSLTPRGATAPLPCCCCGSWFSPAGWERRKNGALLYRLLGAGLLIRLLKTCSCYPRPLEGTQRGSVSRERALILTVPLTIQYEAGHLFGGLLHLAAVSAVFAASAASGGGRIEALQGWMLGAQLVVIWFIHIMPVLAQRLNRGRLLWAIEDLRVRNKAETGSP